MTISTLKTPGGTSNEIEQPNGVGESKKGIENHKSAAKHHQDAARHHLEAAKHHEQGNHTKAHESTVLAIGHSIMASDCQREDAKHHALNSK